MNALANDQRERLGEICEALRQSGSGFAPTFGQYIGQTPENARDSFRNATARIEERLGPSELVLREEMRRTPPHILLTNYSMLEYLLIRPNDSPLFDEGRAARWKFIVLDEAHQYRGAKGMEMGMLIRRLKQRLRDGGRQSPFKCIATSATISSGTGPEERREVAQFAQELFGEPFAATDVIFSEFKPTRPSTPRRYHAFLRALEGAFLIHRDGEDQVVLNRKSEGEHVQALEIALCRECGQHYYVGRERGGKLVEAIRDPSHSGFGVDYYLPAVDGVSWLCRRCGSLSNAMPQCDCGAALQVKRCESHKDHPDQLKQCETCGYHRGGIGDPVQEIVHGSDGPNAVIATALHELLPSNRRKVLAFADSRQEAAFFAWYAEDSYEKLRDRNLMLRAIKAERVGVEGLSVDDLQSRLLSQWTEAGLFRTADTAEHKRRQVLAIDSTRSDHRRETTLLDRSWRCQVVCRAPRATPNPRSHVPAPLELHGKRGETIHRTRIRHVASSTGSQPSFWRWHAGLERGVAVAADGLRYWIARKALSCVRVGRASVDNRQPLSPAHVGRQRHDRYRCTRSLNRADEGSLARLAKRVVQ